MVHALFCGGVLSVDITLGWRSRIFWQQDRDVKIGRHQSECQQNSWQIAHLTQLARLGLLHSGAFRRSPYLESGAPHHMMVPPARSTTCTSLARTALIVAVALSALACSKVIAENYAIIKPGQPYSEVIEVLGKPARCDYIAGFRSCSWGDDKSSSR
jgi:hypothetical protein